jgi:hypothetical protein
MAGAPDPSVASALEAQSKSMEAQSRTLATQSQLLQQLCDRLESQDHRWSQMEDAVKMNTTNISKLQEKLGDGEIEAFRTDLTRSLGDRVEAQIAQLEAATLGRVDGLVTETSNRVAVLENATSAFESWRPRVEHSVDGIRNSVDTLRSDLARLTQFLERNNNTTGDHRGQDSILGPYVPAGEHTSASPTRTGRPDGHGTATTNREYGFGKPHPIQLPINGICSSQPRRGQSEFHSVPCGRNFDMNGVEGPGHFSAKNLGNLPKIHFPSFDGDNPRLWQKRCEDYFIMYEVDPAVWIRVSSMQFTGPAARWLQSVESRVSTMSWGEFGRLILERFGKDQHQLLLRQLFSIRQTHSVASYVDEFSQLVDKLNAYQTMSDPLYYTLKFVDGLRDEVKAVVMLQRPSDLDTAMVLAQLQEEAGAMMKRTGSKWGDSTTAFKPRLGAAPAQPVKEPKHMTALSTGDKSIGGTLPSTDDRIASLYAYRKAKGLCYKCGLQYNRGHRCSDTVQLQVVEELWQMVQCTNTEAIPECAEVSEDNVEINVLQLSQAAMDGSEARPSHYEICGSHSRHGYLGTA